MYIFKYIGYAEQLVDRGRKVPKGGYVRVCGAIVGSPLHRL